MEFPLYSTVWNVSKIIFYAYHRSSGDSISSASGPLIRNPWAKVSSFSLGPFIPWYCSAGKSHS